MLYVIHYKAKFLPTAIQSVTISKITNSVSINIKRSLRFRDTLNNNDLKTDPCGTPLLMTDHMLYRMIQF